MSEPTLSVCLITYNHEKYIAQAIESVLMQKVNFSMEFIIAEDRSPDSTREIIRKYAAQNPEIKLILQEKNVGAARNFMDLINAAKGKYVAYLEGDDFWTDSLKLQKQVDFLENNPNFAICFHAVNVVLENDPQKSYISNRDQKEVTDFDDLAFGNYIHTLSCVYRNGLFGDFPDWYAAMEIGDYPLHLLNAQHGKIKFLADVMATYRIRDESTWGHLPEKRMKIKSVNVMKKCMEYFAPLGSENFGKSISNSYKRLAYLEYLENNYKECRRYYFESLKNINVYSAREFLVLTTKYFFGSIFGLTKFRKN